MTLALSDSAWLSLTLFDSLSPDLLKKSLLGSQGPCSARSVATALHHFNQHWRAAISCVQTIGVSQICVDRKQVVFDFKFFLYLRQILVEFL